MQGMPLAVCTVVLRRTKANSKEIVVLRIPLEDHGIFALRSGETEIPD